MPLVKLHADVNGQTVWYHFRSWQQPRPHHRWQLHEPCYVAMVLLRQRLLNHQLMRC